MLRFFACFGCEEKPSNTVSPVELARQTEEKQKPKIKRKLSHESYVGSDTNMASTTNTYLRNEIEDEAYVLQFIKKIKAMDLQNRKQFQYDFIKRYCFGKGPKYIIQKPWSAEYTDFLTKNNKSTLRKVNNSTVIENGRLKSGLLSGKDYFVVSKKVWILVYNLYGGGPIIQKQKMMPIKPLTAFGLQNNRYSCYLNSGLQAIFSIAEFVDYFHYGYFKTENYKTKYSQKLLSLLTQQMVQQLDGSQQEDTFSLGDLRRFIETKFPSVYQHDCQQFMRFYLSRLQDELNPKVNFQNKKLTPFQMLDKYDQSHISIVDILFHGQLNSYTKCAKCDNISIAYDPIMELTLEMSSNSLQQCLDHYFGPEKLLDSYECERCMKKSRATRQFYFGKIPLYLMITMKRFFQNRRKNQQSLQYPVSLNLHAYLKTQIGNPRYRLQSAIIHKGDTQKGHYYIHTERLGKWYQINDSKTKQIDIESNLQTQAYILIYKQI